MAVKKKPVARARAKKARAARPQRPRRSAKPKPRTRRTAKAATRRAAAKPRIDAAELVRALERKVRRLGTARRRLEQRLTAAVQEIGTLRQFELRANQLEEELRKRDAELALLRSNGAAPAAAP